MGGVQTLICVKELTDLAPDSTRQEVGQWTGIVHSLNFQTTTPRADLGFNAQQTTLTTNTAKSDK